MSFGGESAYLKASPLRAGSSRRHALRFHLLRAPAPRLQEYANLCWLRRAGFGAALPLAAGASWRAGAPRFQFLLTRRVRDGVTLDQALMAADPESRAAILDRLASEVARMHGLRFVHRDLFPRNLLVSDAAAAPRITMIDCWAGGRGCQRRGPSYDLACLFLDGAQLFEPLEQAVFLRRYLAARRIEGTGAAQSLVRRIRRERQGLVAKLRRDPARLHGKPAPGDWPPEGLHRMVDGSSPS